MGQNHFLPYLLAQIQHSYSAWHVTTEPDTVYHCTDKLTNKFKYNMRNTSQNNQDKINTDTDVLSQEGRLTGLTH